VLRIEDTDTLQRSTQQSVDAIFEALEWLGIDWDDGPYFQSERLDVYREHMQTSYWSPRGMPITAPARRKSSKPCAPKPWRPAAKPEVRRHLSGHGSLPPSTDNAVVRFKAAPPGTTVVWTDRGQGQASCSRTTELDDFIICRSDGMPTYNLAVVVDDITMGSTPSSAATTTSCNTPKQILIYQCPGRAPAGFRPCAHGPGERPRASEQAPWRHLGHRLPGHGRFCRMPCSIIWCAWDGPTAIRNFSPADELIEKFTLENIGKSAGVFRSRKNCWRSTPNTSWQRPSGNPVRHLMLPLLRKQQRSDCPATMKAKPGFIERCRRNPAAPQQNPAGDGRTRCGVLFQATTIEYEQRSRPKNFLKPTPLSRCPDCWRPSDWNSPGQFRRKDLEAIPFRRSWKTGLKLGKIAQPVRVALTGRTASPGIFEMIAIIGKDKVLDRLRAAIANHIRKALPTNGLAVESLQSPAARSQRITLARFSP
jgi:glutamyl-tRNA synthetase